MIKILTKFPILAKHAVDTPANKSAPALVVAAENGQAEVVRLLMLRGADAESANADTDNAFHVAARGAHAAVLDVLLKKTTHLGLNSETKFPHPVDCENKNGETPFKILMGKYKSLTDPTVLAPVEACLVLLMNAGASAEGVEALSALVDLKGFAQSMVSMLVSPSVDVLAQVHE